MEEEERASLSLLELVSHISKLQAPTIALNVAAAAWKKVRSVQTHDRVQGLVGQLTGALTQEINTCALSYKEKRLALLEPMHAKVAVGAPCHRFIAGTFDHDVVKEMFSLCQGADARALYEAWKVYHALQPLEDVFSSMTRTKVVEVAALDFQVIEGTKYKQVRAAVGAMIASQTLWKELAKEDDRVSLASMCIQKLSKTALLPAIPPQFRELLCKTARMPYEPTVAGGTADAGDEANGDEADGKHDQVHGEEIESAAEHTGLT